jgi:hypothetical protein
MMWLPPLSYSLMGAKFKKLYIAMGFQLCNTVLKGQCHKIMVEIRPENTKIDLN